MRLTDFDCQPEDALGIIVDVQERFLSAIPACDHDGTAGAPSNNFCKALRYSTCQRFF